MTSSSGKNISARLRSHFAAIADALIPAFGQLPKASDVGIAEGLLDHVLAVRPDLTDAFIRGLEATVGLGSREAAEFLSRSDAESFDAISTIAAGGYFLDEQVRHLIGYPGQESVSTEAPYALPSYATDGTLRRVYDRGPIYRPTPGTSVLKHQHLIGGQK